MAGRVTVKVEPSPTSLRTLIEPKAEPGGDQTAAAEPQPEPAPPPEVAVGG